jgi:hypothetical protein
MEGLNGFRGIAKILEILSIDWADSDIKKSSQGIKALEGKEESNCGKLSK